MTQYNSYSGTILTIEDILMDRRDTLGCNKIFTIEDSEKNIITFHVSPSTYFIDNITAKEGDYVTGFYDNNAPVPLIYPPRFQALIMAVGMENINVKVDFFNRNLVSSDGMLRLNISPNTQITLENGQSFFQNPANHTLIVLYGPTTRSIPAMTTPYEIIVICDKR